MSLRIHARLFLRFALVGATGVAVNIAVLFLLLTYLHVWVYFAEMIAAGTAAGSNYSLNVAAGVIKARPLKETARVEEDVKS